LFFCVGPCGVDKDALLKWTKDHLSDQHRFVFAQCVSMRPTSSIKWRESHLKDAGMTCDTVDFATFWQSAAEGQFAMVWQANDLYYGIRRGIEADLKAGCDVVVNGSRAYVPQLRSTFPNSIVVWIDPQESPLRSAAPRIEKGPAVLKQLHRASSIFTPPNDPHVVQLNSDGSLESVGHRLLDVLSSTSSQLTSQSQHVN
jgi:ribose 1,5-bisphosphokinase